MVLISSISNTKNFLQKTLENFKSCFSPSYQKLPKTPPHNQFSYSVGAVSDNNNPYYKDLEKFYSDFTQQWDDSKKGKRRRSKKKEEQVQNNESFISLNNASQEKKNNELEKREECDKKKSLTHERSKQKDSSLKFIGKKGNEKCMVEKKLRELEMLDKSDVDYVLDIEEVIHYYSRLTCPLYLEIVEKFFMEMYSEFFDDHVKPVITPRTPSINSRLKLRS